MSNLDIVVTSLNPFQRVSHQVKCIKRWQSLGYKVVAAQNEKEARVLERQGLDPTNIEIMGDADTAIHIHGKAIPRIAPILNTVAAKYDPERVVLVNADIYPGIGSKLNGLHVLHSCGALTRMDVLSLEPIALRRAKSYRGGLDCFFFDRPALKTILNVLSEHAASSRMTFGVPGWDFYLAGAMLRFVTGSALLDGRDLFHKTHPQTYSDMAEFSYYIPDLQNWEIIGAHDPYEASNQFLNAIIEQCDRSAENSKMVSTMHRDFKVHHKTIRDGKTKNDTIDPSVEFVRKFALDENFSAKAVLDFYCQSESVHVRFGQALECLLIIREALKSTNKSSYSFEYPAASLHKQAILNALRLGEPNAVRYCILELFVSDLTEHNVCNRRLLSYLALACTNDRERSLVTRILESLKVEANATTD